MQPEIDSMDTELTPQVDALPVDDEGDDFLSLFDEEFKLSANSEFLSMPKEGSPIKFIIMNKGITGYIYWNNQNRPVRLKKAIKVIPDPQKPDTTLKTFAIFPVFCLDSNSFKLLEVTQKSVLLWMREVQREGNDDILSGSTGVKITAEKSGINTTYSCLVTNINPVMGDKAVKLEAIRKRASEVEALWTDSDLNSKTWIEPLFVVQTSDVSKVPTSSEINQASMDVM